jgi:nitrogen fixation protein FixH
MNWKYSIIAFFIVIACVNAVVVYFAVTTGPDLLEDQPYERGLQYQGEIDLQNSASSMGWTAKYEVTSVGQQRFLEASVLDSNMQFVPNLLLTLHAKFPADAKQDFSVNFEQLEEGVYRSRIPHPSVDEKLWIFRLHAKLGDQEMIWKTKELL